MRTIPPVADYFSDRPTTGTLVIGPVRGLWPRHDREPLRGLWVVLLGTSVLLAAVLFLKTEINARLGRPMIGIIPLVPGVVFYVGFLRWFFWSFDQGEVSWQIDDLGVSFTHPNSEQYFLAWDDVDQVRILAGSTLRGRGIQVRFPSSLPEADLREVARRIRERLGEDFHLKPRPRPRASVGSFLWLLATALIWTAVFFATTIGPILIDALGGARIGWIGATAALGWPVLAVVIVLKKIRRCDEEDWVSKRSTDQRSGVSATE